MFHLFTLAARMIMNPYKIIDKRTCRTFLLRLIAIIQSRAAETDTKIDDRLLKHLEFMVTNNALFDYIYSVIFEQLQTEEILFESAEEETIIKLVENAAVKEAESLEAVDPVVIISIISRIISLINAIKNK